MYRSTQLKPHLFELKNSECKSDNNNNRGVNDFETIN